MTQEGDVVLVYMEGQPAFFARIEAITPDVKSGWYQVKMLVLQVPLMLISWILREVYINGEEFTMGGRPVRVVKVVAPEEEESAEAGEASGAGEERPKDDAAAPSGTPPKGKVLSLADRRKKDQPS